MTTAASSRPHGAEPDNPRGPSGASSSGGPQTQVPGQDPGLVHPQLISRPLFYVHAPPPPFMHYQWPMPFYNPFNPFSGMGYGMMMPPFPPAPYMDPPAYFIPHAPVQPMDYRRMVHPQPHPNSAPYQNLNATRRPRPPQSGPARETVNTEVQTEPRGGEFHRESPLRSCSDSGRETAPTSPTSSTSSQKKSNEDVENYNEPNEGLQLKISCTRGSIKPCLPMTSPESMQKMSEDNSLVNLHSLKNRNVHMMRQENMTPVNSPSKDMSKKERRISVPDILMSWGNGTPQEDKMADDDKNEKLPSYEDEIENFQSSTVLNEDQLEPETVDAEKDENEKVESKSHYEPFEHSLSISIKLRNTGHETVNEPTLEEPSGSVQTPNGKFRRKLNESVWSVESLPVYVPTKEWLAQNMTAGPEVILELQEEAENGGQSDAPVNQKNRLNSSTDSVQLSDGFIDFSTPARKMDTKQASNVPSEPKKYNMQKLLNPIDSPIKMKMPEVCAKEIEIIETSEPAQSPKRRSFTVEEKQDKNKESNKEKTIILDSEKASEKESSQKNIVEAGAGLLLVPPLAAMELSPSKGHLVDCGVQFPELQTTRGNTTINRQLNASISDVHNSSTRSEGAVTNWQKKRHNQGRNKGPYRPHSQQDAYFDFYNKPGKQRGGKGRY